ncbi:helix-turn-helix domain-containing protein [Halopelagius fulvigenes]|uniref:Helix-turn-helix domain-containing protein n=1 Tax=Halopelagius fulvigenes TaxID=1198324 RepID=A0ABD5TZY9_9EURY
MSFVATVTISDPPLFQATFDAVPDAHSTLENYHYVEDEPGDRRYVFFCWMSGCDLDEHELALANDPTVGEFKTLADAGDRRLYRIVTEPVPDEWMMLFPFFRDNDITVLKSTRTVHGIHIEARFPSYDALQALKSTVCEAGSDVEIDRIRSAVSPSLGENRLTEKQREAVALAARRGYFETPSRVSLGELAEELGVSPQAVSKRVRAGVEKLVETTLCRSESAETLSNVRR